MPFIDLNALNPLSQNKDGDQGQAAQASDSQTQPQDDQQQTAVDPQTGNDPQAQSDNTQVADDQNAVPEAEVAPAETTAEIPVAEAPAVEVAPAMETPIEPAAETPIEAPADTVEVEGIADPAAIDPTAETPAVVEVDPQVEVAETSETPEVDAQVAQVEASADTAVEPVQTEAATDEVASVDSMESAEQQPEVDANTVELSTSSSPAHDVTNIDQAGKPMPQIELKEGGSVDMDAAGIREVKGPEFGAEQSEETPSPVQELQTQDLDQKLAEVDTEGLDTPDPAEVVVDSTPEVAVVTTAPAAPELPPVDLQAESVEVDLAAPAATEAEAPIEDTVAETEVAPAPQPIPPVDQSAIIPGLATDQNPAVPAAQPMMGTDPVAGAPLPELSEQTKVYELDELLEQAIKMGASDLHLTAGYRAVVRIDGELQQIQSQMLDDVGIKKLVAPVLAGVKLENPDDIRDLDLAYQGQDGTRFRVNIYKQQGTQAAVFRVIPSEIQSLEQLGLPDKLKEFTKMSQGLVLVTGPTGSGKSTTLAAMVNEINMNDPRHIVTIEDPVEFVYATKGKALVDQRAVKQDTDNWGDALRSVLRQDPDVVLIGEMRDLETISSALHIAETGHLVFATLHTNSAAQSIDRIIDVFPKEQQAQIQTMLASVLSAVVSQRLVPVRGGGRRVAMEIMIATSAVRNSIRSSKVYQIDNIIQTSGDQGMVSMEKSLAGLVKSSAITTDQAQFYANRPDEVLALLGQKRN